MPTVLLLEDDYDSGTIIERQLTKKGYGVLWCRTQEQGMYAFKARGVEYFCAIILDGTMPQKGLTEKPSSTLGRLQEFKERGYRGPIIANSAHYETREEQRKAGVTSVCPEKLEVAGHLEECLLASA